MIELGKPNSKVDALNQPFSKFYNFSNLIMN